MLCQIFVFWVRDIKFWLLAYFLISSNCAKFQQNWTTLMLDILRGSPLWIFGTLQKHQIHKVSNIKFVQSCWNFAWLKKIKSVQLKVEVTNSKKRKKRKRKKNGATISFPGGLEDTPFTNSERDIVLVISSNSWWKTYRVEHFT